MEEKKENGSNRRILRKSIDLKLNRDYNSDIAGEVDLHDEHGNHSIRA